MSAERKLGPEEKAFETVSLGFRSGATKSVKQRIEWLKTLEGELVLRENDLLSALCADLGKPALEAWLAEYRFVLEDLRLHQKKLQSWTKKSRVTSPFHTWPARSWTQREPYGCALIFSPWNYPVQLSLSPLIGAIAAGNTVVLKPSEFAPESARFLESLLLATFPADVVRVVQGDGDVAARLSELRFDHFFYTGSERYGRSVAHAAAEQMSPCVLELGGKCPVVIGPGADIEKTVERVVAMKLFNLGQTCFAPDYVLVPAADQHRWVQKFQAAFDAEWEGNDPSEFAKVVNERQLKRVLQLHPEARAEGERIRPLAFAAGWTDAVMQEEIFGPLLPVVPYDGSIPEELKQREEALAAYFFSNEEEWLDRWITEVPSGGVTINDVGKHTINHALPFGGVGASGYGRYRGRISFETFSWERSFTKRYFVKDFFLMKRPYGKTFEMLKRFMK